MHFCPNPQLKHYFTSVSCVSLNCLLPVYRDWGSGFGVVMCLCGMGVVTGAPVGGRVSVALLL